MAALPSCLPFSFATFPCRFLSQLVKCIARGSSAQKPRPFTNSPSASVSLTFRPHPATQVSSEVPGFSFQLSALLFFFFILNSCILPSILFSVLCSSDRIFALQAQPPFNFLSYFGALSSPARSAELTQNVFSYLPLFPLYSLCECRVLKLHSCKNVMVLELLVG